MTHDEAMKVQIAINSRGFGPVAADGVVGRQTLDAIKRFQRANSLMPDGVVGRKTAEALGLTWPIMQPGEPVTAPPANSAPPSGGSVLITERVLNGLFPNGRDDIVAAIVRGAPKIAAARIITEERSAQFLCNIGVETGGLSSINESLNYSVDGLMKTFGRHRISAADCKKYGRTKTQPANQEMIANIIYGGEWGAKNLGNTEPGDGWRYRGGGILQNTGRANYRRAGFENNPEALRNPDSALEAALSFWTQNNLNAIADTGSVPAVRKCINGGSHGLEEALEYYAKAKRLL